MAEHDFNVKPVAAGYLVSHKSDSSPETWPPGNSPTKGNAAYKFLSDYASTVNPGDTVRVNGRVFPTIAKALDEAKRLLNPPPQQPTRQISNPSRQRRLRKR